MKQAEVFKCKIEAIVSDQIVGRTHDNEISHWLRNLEPKMQLRLERAGLAKATRRGNVKLKAFPR